MIDILLSPIINIHKSVWYYLNIISMNPVKLCLCLVIYLILLVQMGVLILEVFFETIFSRENYIS